MKTKLRKTAVPAVAAAIFSLMFAGSAQAHCDALDGPVITEARAALESGNVKPLLKWVPAKDEAEIKRVFADVLKSAGKAKLRKTLPISICSRRSLRFIVPPKAHPLPASSLPDRLIRV